MTRYQALAVTTVGVTLVLITIGAVVRTTGSGLGCPDWPLCHGQWLPPAERTAIIEYTHRTAAAIVGLFIVATAAVALLRHRGDTVVRNLAVAAVVLLAVQAWLGKETVERELPPEIVTLHLGTALTLLAVLSVLTVFAFYGEQRRRIESRERAAFVRLATITAAILLVILLGGSYVVGSDSTTACTTWPGCLQAPVPFVDGVLEQHIHWAHRLSTLVGLGAVGFVALSATELRGPLADRIQAGSMVLLGLYGLQMLVGAANIWTTFSDVVRASHLALGAMIWAAAVLLVVAAAYEPGEATEETEASRSVGDGREAARA
ncbi:MAG: COX15/CtaA family protein [Chloroflexi bacterium]|nr:COX15/CtaA family protein [Chloroflexota bacterium]